MGIKRLTGLDDAEGDVKEFAHGSAGDGLTGFTVGFEALAEITHKPSKSLHRMLSERGNPSMDNLAAIFGAIKNRLGVNFDVRVVEVT